MGNLLNNAISIDLLFVYGLIAIVVILIIAIIIIDKKESKKKPQNLFDTLNMKIIADPYTVNNENNNNTDVEIKKEEQVQPEVLEIPTSNNQVPDFNIEPLHEVNIVNTSLKDEIETIEEEIYTESDLEKTQAQIRVEEITKALEEAGSSEKQEKDRYEQFEEEQEKNAIISYNELMKSFDKLYNENEKIQYLEDDEIPINIEELYQMQNQTNEKEKTKLEDFITIKKETENIVTKQQSESTFKNSPYISPVYGIQEPPLEVRKVNDSEIESANQFLKSLKELKNNLD